jgi:tetratricopeptide (TPR) repeat protein
MATLKATLLVLLGALIAAGAASRVDRLRAGIAPGHHLLYLPSGRYLKVMTFGYDALAADLIYIWSIQYYSNYQILDRYDYLDQIYRRVIAELDPHFLDPYLVGSMIMSVEANRDDLALRLLDAGAQSNPREWIIPFQAGFLCFYKLHDYARARDYFEKAEAIPGAPAPVRRLHAEMFNRLGDKRSALRYWVEIHDTADSDYVRQVSWLHVHDLSIEVTLEDLNALVARYRQQEGANPKNLEVLVRSGMLAAIPLDPDGRPCALDPATGEARSASRRLLQGQP